MLNEKETKQTLTDKLKRLGQEQENLAQILNISFDSDNDLTNFVNDLESQPQNNLNLLSCLLEVINEQNEEIKKQQEQIENFQAITHGAYSQLSRRKARRISLGSNHEEETNNNTFISVSPRLGSLAHDFKRPLPPFRSTHSTPRFPIPSPSLSSPSFSLNSPLLSATIPKSPLPSPHDLGSVLEDFVFGSEQFEEDAESVINGLNFDKKKLEFELNKLREQLKQKEREIKWLEDDKVKSQEIEEENLKVWTLNSNLKNSLENSGKRIGELELELKETNDDFLQVSDANVKLNKLLSEREAQLLSFKQIEEHLDQEKKENEFLETKYLDTKRALEDQLSELVKDKKLAEHEKSELQQIILQREEQYEQSKNYREQAFKKQIDNLRTFQTSDDQPKLRTKGHFHSFSLSLPVSRGETPSPSENEQGKLFFELMKNSHFKNNKGNFFNSNNNSHEEINTILNNSPTDYFGAHPLDIETKTKHKRTSSSPFFTHLNRTGSSLVLENSLEESETNLNNTLEEVFSTLDNIEDEVRECNMPEHEFLAEENKSLGVNLVNLEKSWKELHDAQVDFERVFKELNEKNLIKEHELNNISGELDETKYKLAETWTKQIKFQQELTDLNIDYQDFEHAFATMTNEMQGILNIYNIENNLNPNMNNEKKIQELTQKIVDYQETLKNLKVATEEIVRKQKLAEAELLTAKEELVEANEEVKKIEEAREAEDERIEEKLDKAHEEADKLEAQILEITNLFK